MTYSTNFDVYNFNWGDMCEANVIRKIRIAGRMSELGDFIQREFKDMIPSDWDIRDFVSEHKLKVLNAVGLDENGHPLDSNKIDVFLRASVVLRVTVVSDDPEDAAKKAHKEIKDSHELIYVDSDDIEDIVPVAYNDHEGNTKDFPEGFKIED